MHSFDLKLVRFSTISLAFHFIEVFRKNAPQTPFHPVKDNIV